MNCTSCGAKIPDGWANCKVCGATAPDERGIVCKRCGKRAKPGERFCGGCGNSLTGTPPVKVESAPPAVRKKFNPYPILITLVAAIIVILGAISLSDSDFTAYGRGYESTVEKYVDCYGKGEWEDTLELYHEDVLGGRLDDANTSRYDKEQALSVRGREFRDEQVFELGGNWHYSYRITEQENVSGSDFAEIKEECMSEYGVSISAVKVVTVEINMWGYMDQKTITRDIYLVKIGWDWYVLDGFCW